MDRLNKVFRIMTSQDEAGYIGVSYSWVTANYVLHTLPEEEKQLLSDRSRLFCEDSVNLRWVRNIVDIIAGFQSLAEDLKDKEGSDLSSIQDCLELLEEVQSNYCIDCEETTVIAVVLDRDSKEYLCEDCTINRAEEADQARYEDFHGSSQPQTLKEQMEESRKLK